MASLFPYILLAAFYIMLVVRGAEADREDVAQVDTTNAKETIYEQPANNQETSPAKDTFFPALEAISSIEYLILSDYPTGPVNEGCNKVTLYKVIFYTGPMRAPPFGFIA